MLLIQFLPLVTKTVPSLARKCCSIVCPAASHREGRLQMLAKQIKLRACMSSLNEERVICAFREAIKSEVFVAK